MTKQARLGVVLFVVYTLLYAGFVLLNAYAPGVMDNTLGGLNLAIWYGFGLIIVALVLAGIYGFLTRPARNSGGPK